MKSKFFMLEHNCLGLELTIKDKKKHKRVPTNQKLDNFPLIWRLAEGFALPRMTERYLFLLFLQFFTLFAPTLKIHLLLVLCEPFLLHVFV